MKSQRNVFGSVIDEKMKMEMAVSSKQSGKMRQKCEKFHWEWQRQVATVTVAYALFYTTLCLTLNPTYSFSLYYLDYDFMNSPHYISSIGQSFQRGI